MDNMDTIRTDSGLKYVHQAVAWQAVRNKNDDELSVEGVGKFHFKHVHHVWLEDREQGIVADKYRG